MTTSRNDKTKIEWLKFDDKIHVYLASGDILVIPYNYTDKLEKASKKSLENYRLIGCGVGVHFPDIDEDISLDGIIRYKIEHELLAM